MHSLMLITYLPARGAHTRELGSGTHTLVSPWAMHVLTICSFGIGPFLH